MKKIKIILGFTCLVLVAMGCHKKIYNKSKDEGITVVTKDYSAAQLAEGEIIFKTNCNKCHKYHQPGEFTINKWNKVLPKMIGKAKLKGEQAEVLTAWVHAHVKAS
jgi:cytochrome c5